jgi:hypothetical protein
MTFLRFALYWSDGSGHLLRAVGCSEMVLQWSVSAHSCRTTYVACRPATALMSLLAATVSC